MRGGRPRPGPFAISLPSLPSTDGGSLILDQHWEGAQGPETDRVKTDACTRCKWTGPCGRRIWISSGLPGPATEKVTSVAGYRVAPAPTGQIACGRKSCAVWEECQGSQKR